MNANDVNGFFKVRGVLRVGVAIVALVACALLSGCETFRMWGEKGSNTPGQVGGGVSIPFGGKK